MPQIKKQNERSQNRFIHIGENFMKSRFHMLCGSGATGAFAMLSLGGISVPALAQAQSAIEPQLAGTTEPGDIVVTARRRDESLRDVPIAITAITSEQIEKSGVKGVSDIASLTPNVTFSNALSFGTNFLTIRGQTQTDYAPPPAAIVVDGVLTISPLQFNVDEFDVSQIEVLKGPQGAIYGRNAIAGAINITSRKPGDTFEARGLLGYGRGDDWRTKASVSGPIVPGLISALAGVSFQDRRGQIKNVTTGNYSDKGKDLTGRLRVIVTPADNLEFDLKYTYSDAKGRDPGFSINPTGDVSNVSYPFDTNRVGSVPRKLHDLSGRGVWDFGPATATLTLAYVNIKENIFVDFDFSPLDILNIDQFQKHSGFSQELRFTSPSSGKLRWLVGGYHVKYKRGLGASIFIDPFFLGLAPAPAGAILPLGSTNDVTRYETWSGFGQLEYDILDDLVAEAAVRYDDDGLKQRNLAVAGSPQRRAGFSKWQPKATLTYKGITDTIVYASVGQGFRSGDFNASAATFGNPVVSAESVTNYEVGSKTRLFDRKLLIDASLFWTDLKNGQFKLYDAQASTNVGINIDKTRIKGFEVAAMLRVARGISLNSGIGYTDSKVKEFTPPINFAGTPAGFIGKTPPRVSKVTFNVGADLDMPVSDSAELYFRPEYRYVSKFSFDLGNQYVAPHQDLLDMRLGLRSKDAGWSLTGWVKNALNTKVTPSYQPAVLTGHPLGIDAFYPPVGATYGIELGFRF
jgi:iron complex outermembrane receptor protein